MPSAKWLKRLAAKQENHNDDDEEEGDRTAANYKSALARIGVNIRCIMCLSV